MDNGLDLEKKAMGDEYLVEGKRREALTQETTIQEVLTLVQEVHKTVQTLCEKVEKVEKRLEQVAFEQRGQVGARARKPSFNPFEEAKRGRLTKEMLCERELSELQDIILKRKKKFAQLSPQDVKCRPKEWLVDQIYEEARKVVPHNKEKQRVANWSVFAGADRKPDRFAPHEAMPVDTELSQNGSRNEDGTPQREIMSRRKTAVERETGGEATVR